MYNVNIYTCNDGGFMDKLMINPISGGYSQFFQAPALANAADTSRAGGILDEAITHLSRKEPAGKADEKKAQEIVPQPLTVDAFYSLKDMRVSKISADGKLLLCADPNDGKEKIYDAETKKFSGEKTLRDIRQKKYQVLDFSLDGKSLIVLSKEERFVARMLGGKQIKARLFEWKIYAIDITGGGKNMLTSINFGTKVNIYNYEYIREQNTFYFVEGAPQEKTQDEIIHYRGNGELKRISRVNLNAKADKTPKVIYELNRGDCDIENFKYSPDGKYMAYEKNGEIYLYEIENKKELRITDNHRGKDIKGWTADSKNIIFTQRIRDNTGNAQSELWLFNTDKKILKRLTDGEDTFADNDVFISKNSERNYIYYSIPKGFNTEVHRIDLAGVNLENVSLRRDGLSEIRRDEAALPQSQIDVILSAGDGFVSSWRVSDDAEKIYYKTDTQNSTRVLNCIAASSNKKEVVSDPNKDFFKKYIIPESEIKSFKMTAEDGKEIEIEYQITYPPGYKNDDSQKYPVILLIHGGPNERFNASFQSFENPKLLASQGYIVIAPNIRGSKGYGQAFLESVYSGKHANISEKSYNDVMAVLKHVENSLKNKKDDASKMDTLNICLFGFSYGGTTVNYIISRKNNDKDDNKKDNNKDNANRTYNIKCAVSGAGEAAYLPTINAPKLFFPKDVYGDLYLPENEVRVYKASALAALAESCKDSNFRTPPTLIIHGTDDKTVPFEESKNLYSQLESRRMDARLIPYNRVGHSSPGGLRGGITHYNYVINWFNRHCRPDKEIYDSRVYCVYSHDGRKRLNDINFSQSAKAGDKKPKNGKFAVIEFTLDFKGILTSDMLKEVPVLTDENGNRYLAIGVLNESGGFEELKGNRLYLSSPKKFRLVFDVPEKAEKFILKINGFPPVQGKII